MPFSMSFTIKTAMMILLFVGVYYTISNEVDMAQKTKYYSYMKEIGLYVEGKLLDGMNSVNIYASNTTEKLVLPAIGTDYSVQFYCDSVENFLAINVKSESVGRNYLIQEYVNCSRVSANGTVYAGEQCLNVKRVNATNIMITASKC